MDYNSLQRDLKEWFLKERRPLPWRSERTPYATLVAEVMLQQTQASVVIPYFKRWMELFPTVEALHLADEESVLKAWEGLGYYSRARNLHAAAKKIVSDFHGKFPETKEQLLSIRGIGSYTVGALLAFAFQKRAPAIDGNVTRVISRLFNIKQDVGVQKIKREIEQFAEALLPSDEPYINAEALIELGALVCKKTPLCQECPLKNHCLGRKAGNPGRLPIKKGPPPTISLTRIVGVIQRGDELLLFSEKNKKVMQGLHQFPYLEYIDGSPKELFEKEFGLKLHLVAVLDEVVHSFTRYRATLRPFLFQTEENCTKEPLTWVNRKRVGQLTFSSGHRSILKQWTHYENTTA